jgi:hypothetical protein
MVNRQEQINYYGYKSINEMISSECTPLLDILLKLSSIASNFASAANNAKNVTMSETHQIKELMDLTFEVRKLAEKVEKVVEDRIDYNIKIIKTGVFEQILTDNVKEDVLVEAMEIGNAFKATLGGNPPIGGA